MISKIYWSGPVSRHMVGLMSKVVVNLRRRGLSSDILVTALVGHDVPWVTEHPVEERQGLVSQRSMPHRRKLDISENEPAE
eukprot:3566432-Pyramimonas_sp.AAC.1